MGRYVKIPEEVLRDERLSPFHKLVYGELAMSSRGSKRVIVGQREIATQLKSHAPTVCRALRELEKTEHIKKEKGGPGKRSSYVFTSGIYTAKFRGEPAEVVAQVDPVEIKSLPRHVNPNGYFSNAEVVRRWNERQAGIDPEPITCDPEEETE